MGRSGRIIRQIGVFGTSGVTIPVVVENILPAQIPLDVKEKVYNIIPTGAVVVDFAEITNTFGQSSGIIHYQGFTGNTNSFTLATSVPLKGNSLDKEKINSISYIAINGKITHLFNNIQTENTGVVTPPADTTAATIDDFIIIPDYPRRMFFSSSEPIVGTGFSGFSIPGMTIISRYIDAGNLTGHYLETSADFTPGVSYNLANTAADGWSDEAETPNLLVAFGARPISNTLAIPYVLLDYWKKDGNLNNQVVGGSPLTIQSGATPVYIASKPAALGGTQSFNFQALADGTTNYMNTGRAHPNVLTFMQFTWLDIVGQSPPYISNILGGETNYCRLYVRYLSSQQTFIFSRLDGTTKELTATLRGTHNAWNHIAFTMDKVAQTLEVYVNGVLSDTFTGVNITAVQSQMLLAYTNNGSPDSMNNTRARDTRIYSGRVPLAKIQDIIAGADQ